MNREEYALVAFGIVALSVIGLWLLVRAGQRAGRPLKIIRTNNAWDEFHIGQ